MQLTYGLHPLCCCQYVAAHWWCRGGEEGTLHQVHLEPSPLPSDGGAIFRQFGGVPVPEPTSNIFLDSTTTRCLTIATPIKHSVKVKRNLSLYIVEFWALNMASQSPVKKCGTSLPDQLNSSNRIHRDMPLSQQRPCTRAGRAMLIRSCVP